MIGKLASIVIYKTTLCFLLYQLRHREFSCIRPTLSWCYETIWVVKQHNTSYMQLANPRFKSMWEDFGYFTGSLFFFMEFYEPVLKSTELIIKILQTTHHKCERNGLPSLIWSSDDLHAQINTRKSMWQKRLNPSDAHTFISYRTKW